MSDYWDDLKKSLKNELEIMNQLKLNLLSQQGLIINHQAEKLKDYISEQQLILEKCNQSEQYRLKIMKKIEETGGIPSFLINVKQLFQYCPKIHLTDLKEWTRKLKLAAFDVHSVNRQNQMLLNNAIHLIDEELSLFTLSKEKNLYHRSGEIHNTQRRNLLNKRG